MNIPKRACRKIAGPVLAPNAGCTAKLGHQSRLLVNDVHAQLNPTFVHSINLVYSLAEVRQILHRARREQRPVSIAGGRHAAGGQQFATNAELIDTRELRRVLHFDPVAGMIEVESGIQWPEFTTFLSQARDSVMKSWTVAQKQTGTDRLSIGGALSANAHGRGLSLSPFIEHVESFVLMDANGNCHTCSRQENVELFKLAIGGYGLFGFLYSAKLRLVPLCKVRRVVNLINIAELPGAFAERIRNGYRFGDFQFAIDSKSDDFLRRGILACYEPVPESTPLPAAQRKLSADDWKRLICLAHTDPTEAFELYARHYLATSGQIYWSDTQYASDYFEDYHRELDAKLHSSEPATDVIGELNVPLDSLPCFLNEARDELHGNDKPPLIYGTVRLIEKDNESFLPWAKQSYACIIFNLHTPHTPAGISRTSKTFQRLIDLAIRHGGSYYLTYHRYATRDQVLACYPQFPKFLRLKRLYDPEERFQSDWYRHYKQIFA